MKHSLELLIDFSRRRREIPPVLCHIFDPPVPRAEGDRDNWCSGSDARGVRALFDNSCSSTHTCKWQWSWEDQSKDSRAFIGGRYRSRTDFAFLPGYSQAPDRVELRSASAVDLRNCCPKDSRKIVFGWRADDAMHDLSRPRVHPVAT